MTAVIIVNYATADLTIDAVASLFARDAGAVGEVHIVDNASPGADATTLAAAIASQEIHC